MTKAFYAFALALMLAGCAPTPEPVVIPTVPGIDPVTGQPVPFSERAARSEIPISH